LSLKQGHESLVVSAIKSAVWHSVQSQINRPDKNHSIASRRDHETPDIPSKQSLLSIPSLVYLQMSNIKQKEEMQMHNNTLALKGVSTQQAFKLNIIVISVTPALKVVKPVPDPTSLKVLKFTLGSSPNSRNLIASQIHMQMHNLRCHINYVDVQDGPC
jgi:hypothetical protein